MTLSKTNIFNLALILLCLILPFSLSSLKSESSILTSPHVIQKDSIHDQLFQFWELDARYIRSKDQFTSYDLSFLNAYRDTLNMLLGKEKLHTLLEEQTPKNNAISIGIDSLSNKDLVHNGKAGMVRDISFLEAEILNYQMERYPMISHPTEFHAFILLNDSLNKVRIYFASSDMPWPPKPTPMIPFIEKDIKGGWDLYQHLHNHYESPEELYLGSMAPSKADVHYFKILKDRFNLNEAVITNGFNTLVISAEQLDQFHSH